MGERRRLAFVVESGTDARLVEGLAERFDLAVLARDIPGGVAVSHAADSATPVETGPAGRLAFARAAGRWLQALRPERVLVQGYGPAALATHLAVGRTSRVFMLVCSPVEAYYRCRRAAAHPDKPYRRSAMLALTALARANAWLGQHYVVLSDYLGTVVRTHGGRLPVSVIPVYGVDTQRFVPTNRPRAELKRSLGLPDRPLLFFSSRIAPEKDAQTLLAAIRRMVDRGTALHLLHRSGGHRAFASAAAAFGLSDHVTATDARPPAALPTDYQAADLCVQASREEGLGFSPLEALACGTPVVAAAVGGLRETIVPGDTGWTYPAGDAAALADAIAEALRDPTEGTRRAARGRRLVEDRYERRLVFDRLDRVLA